MKEVIFLAAGESDLLAHFEPVRSGADHFGQRRTARRAEHRSSDQYRPGDGRAG